MIGGHAIDIWSYGAFRLTIEMVEIFYPYVFERNFSVNTLSFIFVDYFYNFSFLCNVSI